MAPATQLHSRSTAAAPPLRLDGDSVAMRQLRHHTKNALQRIIAQLATTELRATPAGVALADDLERRICLSARISDALFGFTAAPGALEQRLTGLCTATVALLAHGKQSIAVDVAVTGQCPVALHPVVMQMAHEMVANAVKHGMHMRLTGRIALRLRAGRGVSLLVSDDGWGLRSGSEGEGLLIMRELARQHGGAVALSRVNGWTEARMDLPEDTLS